MLKKTEQFTATISRCPFEDCKSTDIVGTDGGEMTLAVTQYNGRLFDGNQTSLSFRCKDCGESFVLTYQIRVPDRIEITEELLDEIFSENAFTLDTLLLSNQVNDEVKKTGGHLP